MQPGFRVQGPYVDIIWLWVYYNKTPIYLTFYILKGDYTLVLSTLCKGVKEQ